MSPRFHKELNIHACIMFCLSNVNDIIEKLPSKLQIYNRISLARNGMLVYTCQSNNIAAQEPGPAGTALGKQYSNAMKLDDGNRHDAILAPFFSCHTKRNGWKTGSNLVGTVLTQIVQ